MQPDTPMRQARKAKELTLFDLSKATGTDTGNLSRIERGIQIPLPELAEKIAGILGITEAHIFYPERFAENTTPNEAA